MQYPDPFTREQRQVLARLEDRDRRERAQDCTDPLKLKALAPEVARLLHTLVLLRQAKLVAEFGTSAGYSTIHLAEAAARVGGRVWSLDREPRKTAWARDHLERCGLAARVELVTGSCEAFAESLPAGLGLVLLDFSVDAFLPVWPVVRARMATSSLLFVDGFGTPDRWESEPSGRKLVETLAADPDFIASPLDMAKGHLLAVRAPPVARA